MHIIIHILRTQTMYVTLGNLKTGSLYFHTIIFYDHIIDSEITFVFKLNRNSSDFEMIKEQKDQKTREHLTKLRSNIFRGASDYKLHHLNELCHRIS